MRRRLAKKVLADPCGYSIRTVRTAARVAGLEWWCGDEFHLWGELSELPKPRARRFYRRLHIRDAGRHDRWACPADDVPF